MIRSPWPWIVQPGTDGFQLEIVDANGLKVAAVLGLPNDPQKEHNAHLMANAPMLTNALVELLGNKKVRKVLDTDSLHRYDSLIAFLQGGKDDESEQA